MLWDGRGTLTERPIRSDIHGFSAAQGADSSPVFLRLKDACG